MDERYEATASAEVSPVIPIRELDRLRSAAGLPELEEGSDTPFLPGGHPALAELSERAARARGLPPPDMDDVRVIDTDRELVFPKYKEPERRLKVKVEGADPEATAMLANAVLEAYLAEQERVLVEGLRTARATLLRAATPRLRRAAPPLRLEAAEAAEIGVRLKGGLSTTDVRRAETPSEPILPHVARDTIVALIVGALVGLLLIRRRRPAQAAPAPAASAS